MPGVPWHTQILADQLTLFQPGGTDYAHLITTGTPGFYDLPTALRRIIGQFSLPPPNWLKGDRVGDRLDLLGLGVLVFMQPKSGELVLYNGVQYFLK